MKLQITNFLFGMPGGWELIVIALGSFTIIWSEKNP